MSPRAALRPKLVTVAEAADQLALTASQVYKLINRGELASVRYPSPSGTGPGPRRIEQSEIDQFIARHRQEAS